MAKRYSKTHKFTSKTYGIFLWVFRKVQLTYSPKISGPITKHLTLARCCAKCIILFNPHNNLTVIIPILQMRKPRIKELKSSLLLVWFRRSSHTAWSPARHAQ